MSSTLLPAGEQNLPSATVLRNLADSEPLLIAEASFGQPLVITTKDLESLPDLAPEWIMEARNPNVQ